MYDAKEKNAVFTEFKNKYKVILEDFFCQAEDSEFYLNEGYKLGRESVAENITLLNVTSIHHDILIDFLSNLSTNNHVMIARKASVFFEEVLAPFEMITQEFREAIKLLNKHSIQFASHIHDLKDEIVERKQAEEKLEISKEKYRSLSEKLQKSLKEKEALLKEVYHRVKNNLQVITSLINLQLETIENDMSRQALIESVTRVKSMALVHEMLYQSMNLSEIEVGEYVEKLIYYLYEIYNINRNTVKFSMENNHVVLPIDKAVTFGLIINEIISNSLKHAFPNQKKGEIKFSITKEGDSVILQIQDNGVGFPANFDPENAQTLGIRLIYNLTKQLSGHVNLDSKNGTTFKLVT
ncbi:MAG: histidine kinase dimerization/phosphoacceptor domain -containing protein [Gammaproteobacteria bacterium]|nr:histidine kinase dimerization/phosphoacceptor domain -containing protein [Gammaproteobacteria bacterium]